MALARSYIESVYGKDTKNIFLYVDKHLENYINKTLFKQMRKDIQRTSPNNIHKDNKSNRVFRNKNCLGRIHFHLLQNVKENKLHAKKIFWAVQKISTKSYTKNGLQSKRQLQYLLSKLLGVCCANRWRNNSFEQR